MKHVFNEADKIAMENYGIDADIIEKTRKIEEEIAPIFAAIEEKVEFNQIKVLDAMRKSSLSDYHLTDSTGYGYNDMGREAIEEIFKSIFRAEDALVRPQIISGTHAITLCLLGILRPDDELLSATGAPYDTLGSIVYGKNCGSLADYRIGYREVDLKDGKPDFEAIKDCITSKTKMVLIQRSRGYSLRPSLSIDTIQELISYIKGLKSDIICFVDNCYGELVETREPIEVGADLCAGSLIKNLGGGIAPTGGYVVGKSELIKQCFYRLAAPGLNKNCGPSIFTNRLIAQGIFYAPMVVGEAVKSAVFTSKIMEDMGFKVYPKYSDKRTDIVTAIELGSKDKLINFCQGIQKVGPVDSHVKPEPSEMPGYNHKVIMAGGSFIQGSSIEFSADAPLKEPYIVYVQGGINFFQAKLGILSGLQSLRNL